MRGCTEPSLLFFFPKSLDTDVKSSKAGAFLVYAFFFCSGVIEQEKWSQWGEREFDSLELPLINTYSM